MGESQEHLFELPDPIPIEGENGERYIMVKVKEHWRKVKVKNTDA